MKKDEFNKHNISNADGHLNVDENPLKIIKEVEKTKETEQVEDEVFQSSEENKIEEDDGRQSFESGDNSNGDSSSSSSSSAASGATGVSSVLGVVGGAIGAIAIASVLVIGVIKLPTIPVVDANLITASSSSLSFALSTNIENHDHLTISLKGESYEITTPFQEYVKFTDLKQNNVYTLSVYEESKSYYSSNFYTNESEDLNNITITVTSYIDDRLLFYFEDSLPGDKLYTVNVKNKSGNVVYKDETRTPKEYEIDHFIEDVAIFVSVNGTISAGVQVFKPVYDYESIEWIWGEYGETVTAIIPSINGTNDYYVRDIRNFEIDRQDSTCFEDGYVIRQAAFIGPDKNRYESQKEFVLPSNGHSFTDIVYTWGEDYSTCYAESICDICEEPISGKVTCVVNEINTSSGVSCTEYVASFANEYFSEKRHYENLTYGRYPQTQVSDNTLISELNNTYGDPITPVSEWKKYSYYASSSVTDFMYYVDADIDSDGSFDYRGVYFTDYRPINTTDALGNTSYQYDNGYQTNVTYWFTYEPIEWDVLDNGDGNLFITSKLILDSQSFYHETNDASFSHNGGLGYANDYSLSDMRLWLNDEFYSLAFSSDRDDVVNVTEVDNSLSSTLDSDNDYVCENTTDRVFLLSRSEAKDYSSYMGLSIVGTDYAKCQGLYVALNTNKGFYSLRTPYPNSSIQNRYITNTGNTSYDSIDKSSMGVRPACWINISNN